MNSIKILIVEDEAVLAMYLQEALESEGYQVVGWASTGEQALSLYQAHQVDLLLCDIHLPGDWDGIQTVHQLTAIRAVPVIYLTAFSDKETLARALLTTPAAYLTKPVTIEGLRVSIELALHQFVQPIKPQEPPIIPAEKLVNPQAPNRETILQIGDSVFIKHNYQFVKVPLGDILFLEAENIYTTLVTTNRKYALRLGLNHILDRLHNPQFVRVHRSYAVNLHQVESFNDREVRVGSVLLPLSRNHREDFLKHFQLR